MFSYIAFPYVNASVIRLSYSLGMYYIDHYVKLVLVPSVHWATLAFIRVLYGSAYLMDPLFCYLKTEKWVNLWLVLHILYLGVSRKKILPHWIIYCSWQYWKCHTFTDEIKIWSHGLNWKSIHTENNNSEKDGPYYFNNDCLLVPVNGQLFMTLHLDFH